MIFSEWSGPRYCGRCGERRSAEASACACGGAHLLVPAALPAGLDVEVGPLAGLFAAVYFSDFLRLRGVSGAARGSGRGWRTHDHIVLQRHDVKLSKSAPGGESGGRTYPARVLHAFAGGRSGIGGNDGEEDTHVSRLHMVVGGVGTRWRWPLRKDVGRC